MWPTTRGQCETNLPDVHVHLLIGDGDEIIAGHGRVEAAKLIGLQSVPAVRLSHLDAAAWARQCPRRVAPLYDGLEHQANVRAQPRLSALPARIAEPTRRAPKPPLPSRTAVATIFGRIYRTICRRIDCPTKIETRVRQAARAGTIPARAGKPSVYLRVQKGLGGHPRTRCWPAPRTQAVCSNLTSTTRTTA
jgi:hypothetical protein